MILQGTRSYDRTKLLAQAGAACKKGRRKKAIALYRRVLEVEPNNTELHGKLAPLLAACGRRAEAVASYRHIAEAPFEPGCESRAIDTYREALGHFPREATMWEAIARLELKRGRRRQALAALHEGRRHLTRRRDRAGAVRLLRRIYEIDPVALEPALDLARTLWRAGAGRHAKLLLERLAERHDGPALRRVRALQLRVRPTPANLVRYVRCVWPSVWPSTEASGARARGSAARRA